MKNPFIRVPGIKVKAGEALSDHTSFRIGGEARYFVSVNSKRALRRVLEIIRRERIPYFLIGAGTNILAPDSGFRGAVLKLSGWFKRMAQDKGSFRCGSGVMIRDFVEEATRTGYGGAEFLAGIPGTIGGAVKGNAGAYGHAIAELIDIVFLMDEYGVERDRARAEISFTYRNSDIDSSHVITAVDLRLSKEKRKVIQSMINRNLNLRQERQPTGYSAGSYFKNPPGHAAGELIEMCGLKGMSIGDAEVSRKHGNYIINKGHARAADVIELAERIKKVVLMQTGIELEEEVRLLS
jgi:UDP-N-acetylmuramate dehydrogenase